MYEYCPKCGEHTDTGFNCPNGCKTEPSEVSSTGWLSDILADLKAQRDLQRSEAAKESMAQNIVKEAHHRGMVFGLNLGIMAIENGMSDNSDIKRT